MHEELSERSRQILAAIVEAHIETAEPVGSGTVVRRGEISLSPATVRNVMAELEERGFLLSPHTSAGRVPTEKAYRFYVDSLLRERPSGAEGAPGLVSDDCLRGLRMEKVLQEVGRTLSNVSHCAGIVMAPRFTSTIFRHIEFIRLSGGRILTVIVSESGLVQNRLIETDERIAQYELDQAANWLNETLSGLSMSEARLRILGKMVQEKALYDQLLRRALRLSQEALAEEGEGQVYIEGTANILDQPEFADLERMKRLLHAFEQKSLLVELLDKSQHADGVQIFFGDDTGHREIHGCSLIASRYFSGRGTTGTLGVIGPMRMPYSQLIPIVGRTARLMSQVLARRAD